MSDSTKDLSTNANEKLGNIQEQLASYGTQLQNYLNNVKADIHDYKFSVEKRENGLDIDVRFKAEVRLDAATDTTK